MNKLVAMKAFCLICERESFAAAARGLDVSPTMVSRYIQQLEKDIGCLLIKRNTRQLTITDLGQHYYREIRPVIDKIESTEREMMEQQTDPKGKLTISASVEFGGQYLAPLVGEYHRKYPGIELNINLSNTPVNLLDDQTDIAIRVAPHLPDASYIAQGISTTRLSLWASIDYLNENGRPESLDDLQYHKLLFFSHSVRKDEWIFNVDGERIKRRYDWAWRTDNGRLLNEAAVLHQGIIQAPGYSVADYVGAGLLVEVMPHVAIDNLVISAVYSHRYALSLRVKKFIELAKAYFEKYPTM